VIGTRTLRRATLIGAFILTVAVPFPVFALQAPPDEFIRTHFTAEDGLSGIVVGEIVRTADGFLWVVAIKRAVVQSTGERLEAET
jgi:ligand-binding sensor domain-containing protein